MMSVLCFQATVIGIRMHQTYKVICAFKRQCLGSVRVYLIVSSVLRPCFLSKSSLIYISMFPLPPTDYVLTLRVRLSSFFYCAHQKLHGQNVSVVTLQVRLSISFKVHCRICTNRTLVCPCCMQANKAWMSLHRDLCCALLYLFALSLLLYALCLYYVFAVLCCISLLCLCCALLYFYTLSSLCCTVCLHSVFVVLCRISSHLLCSVLPSYSVFVVLRMVSLFCL